MKNLAFILGFLVFLSGCSSLITRGELSACQKQCSSEKVKISKKEGKVSCECHQESAEAAICH